MHAPGKGLSQLALPYCRSVPTWLKLTSNDVKEQIYKLAKKGLTPSHISHLKRNRKDKDAKFHLILIESYIYRLARYYETKRVLPPNWKYGSSTASALVA
ncbi:40S ribosomal protein S13-like protein [Camelus ferus]|nr:40S ribosomal protein S13-like protein [Camelus ferus]